MDRNEQNYNRYEKYQESLSARRAWIEMSQMRLRLQLMMSLSARRAWIEIYLIEDNSLASGSRSPQGERG